MGAEATEKTPSLQSYLLRHRRRGEIPSFFLLLPFNLPVVPPIGQLLPEQADIGAQKMQSRVVSHFVVKTRAGASRDLRATGQDWLDFFLLPIEVLHIYINIYIYVFFFC